MAPEALAELLRNGVGHLAKTEQEMAVLATILAKSQETQAVMERDIANYRFGIVGLASLSWR